MWDYKDFHNLISANMATENLEAIVLQRYPRNIQEIQAMTTLSAEALAQMSRLKLLMLCDLNFSGSLNFLSSELGYLYWGKYPFTSLPSSFEPDKLVELILPYSNIRKLWEGIKPLHHLTRISLCNSRNLIMMPSFLEIPNLEYLDLEGCIKLVQIDPSIGVLKRLSELNLKDCENLVSIPMNIFGLSSLKYLNLSGCPKLLNKQLLKRQRQIENLEMFDNKESTIQYKSSSFINKVLKPSFRFSIFRKRKDSVGLLLPVLPRLSCLLCLDLGFCNLVQIPNAIGCLHSLEWLNLGGNNFVTLPNIKELSKLRYLNLEHCKQLKYLPELPSKTVSPLSETLFGRYDAELYIFDCPSLIEKECCYIMAFSWMIQLLQAHMKSDLAIGRVNIVIPIIQIPMWFNKQNVGSSIRMDPVPNMDDKNLIGVACCITFVAHDDPTSLGTGWPMDEAYIMLGFQSNQHGIYPVNPIHLEKDLVTVELDHLLLVFFTTEEFIDFYLTEGLHDISAIELAAFVEQPLGLHLEIKNIGYRWIFKEDVEQLKMMYSGKSSVQNMYLTND